MTAPPVDPVVIENPILNSPCAEPHRHFKFSESGITNEVVGQRRSSAYFVPIAAPKKKGGQKLLSTEWTLDRIRETKHVNLIRNRVGQWRLGGWQGVTPTTRRLLQSWADPERSKPLFFCLVEAVEKVFEV